MMYEWEVEAEIWPISTGRGKAQDESDVGGSFQKFIVPAKSIYDAFLLAEAWARGAQVNPMVWQVRVFSIKRLGGWSLRREPTADKAEKTDNEPRPEAIECFDHCPGNCPECGEHRGRELGGRHYGFACGTSYYYTGGTDQTPRMKWIRKSACKNTVGSTPG